MSEVRCDNHQGENYPPRCSLCESLQADYAFHKIDLPRVDPDHARVVWQGMDQAWAACGRCNFEGPRRYGLLCHGQAAIDLEQHTDRHRNSQPHTTHTTQIKSN